MEVLVLGVVTAIAGLFIEYFVFNPGDGPSQQERNARLLGLSPWAVVLILTIVLVTSAVRKDGKEWWHRRWSCLTGLRPRAPYTTVNKRMAAARTAAEDRRDFKRRMYEEGFAARSAEVAAERAATRLEPTWRVARIEEVEQGEFILYNSGWMVGNVLVDAPRDQFIFDGDPPMFKGDFGSDAPGGSIGKRFYGHPTQKGSAEGVSFSISWTDKNLDKHTRTVRFEPRNAE